MDFVKKNAKDFTIAWIYREANTILEYSNSGNRQAIQWLYVLGGNLQINYTLNGYEGAYNVSTDVLADLRPIKGLETTWITSHEQCHCVAFMSSDENIKYEAELINVSGNKKIESSDTDRFFVPLIPGVAINNNIIPISSYVKVTPMKSATIYSEHPGSPILVFSSINE